MKWILIILMLPAAGCTAIVESFDPTRPRGFQGNIDRYWADIPRPISEHPRDPWLSRMSPNTAERLRLDHHFNMTREKY